MQYKISFAHWVNYLPGLIVLTFSMLALYFSVSIIEAYNHSLDAARFHEVENYNIYESAGGTFPAIKSGGPQAQAGQLQSEPTQVMQPTVMKRRGARSIDMHSKAIQSRLYWSVISLGLIGFILVLLNANKLRQLKEGKEEKEHYLALLKSRLAAMEATLDGIGIIDKIGDLTYMNKALMDLHGIEEHQGQSYLGQNWLKLYTDKGGQDIQDTVLPALEGVGYWRGEAPILRADEQIVWAELTLTRLDDGGLIGTARDITQKRKDFAEKQELQSQFYQAQKMEAIGRLAGGVAHDFNNILAAMNGYAEFLIDDLDQETQQHQFAQNILQAGHQARELVDQILTFSRRKESVSEDMDLLIAVQECLSLLKASMPKTIEIKTEINLNNAPINGNPTQISQVIMNLCVNAKDAMDESHGALTLGLSMIALTDYDVLRTDHSALDGPSAATAASKIQELGEGAAQLTLGQLKRGQGYACLSVTDSGLGMDKIVMEHVFEPFFTTKSVDKGTGLGLATVHGVVLSHGGALMIDSVVGQGTTFKLFFPVIEGFKSNVGGNTMGECKNAGGEILLVEDKASVREMMKKLLQRLGYGVTCARTGLEALDVLRENYESIDLVLTDQNMPKMTGIELVHEAYQDFPDLPFILLSGYSEKKMQKMIHDHVAIKAVLKKPASKNVLAQKIGAILSANTNEGASIRVDVE